jgi:hypothetical protein
MSVRRIVFALAVVGGSLVCTSTTALAVGPKVPPGCTFDQGRLTCTTSSVTAGQLGPETTSSQFIPADTMFDGIAGSQICIAVFGGIGISSPVSIEMDGNTYLDVTITTTTTTQRDGLNGKVVASSSSSTVSLTQVLAGSMGCGWS